MRRGAGLVRVMLMILFSGTVLAQVHEDFGDGNFTQNPPWQGDGAKYEVNAAGQLQLKSAGTDTACLSTASFLIDSTEWRFFIKLAFSPSSNNFARVYLVSDQQLLDGPLHGYFLQFGQAGSNDAITFYRQEGLDTFRICTGIPAGIASAFNLGIKVSRNHQGLWTVMADPGGGFQYQFEAAGVDTFYKQTSWFGFQCRYTSSNATKFFFDDVVIQQIPQDIIPPKLIKVIARDSLSLDIIFSEPINSVYAEDPHNYSIDKGIGQPLLAVTDLQQAGLVHLNLLQPLTSDTSYLLSVLHICDISGNITNNQAISFVYHRLKEFDVVINEIMSDPEPQVGLPPCEYLELYNRSNSPVFLKDWQYSWSTGSIRLPDTLMKPKSYLLLCDKGHGIFMASNGKYIELFGFSLPNSGSDLCLKDPSGSVISFVNYRPEWVRNPLKQEGGWALEQIDPLNPCGGAQNWRECVSTRGGTPGSLNSVHAIQSDQGNPHAFRAYPLDARTIRIVFSESLDSNFLKQDGMYRLDPGQKYPDKITMKAPGYQQLDLYFTDSLEIDKTYSLHFLKQYADCAGNLSSTEDSLRLAIPGIPAVKDVVINEVLFHPKTGGAEFAELYNLSQKALDLKDLVIGTYDSLNNKFVCYGRVLEESYVIFPGDYVVLTDEPDAVLSQYFSPNPEAVIKAFYFPGLTDAGGELALADLSLNIIDKVRFNEDMHYPLLASTLGVSLERIKPDAISNLNSSWHSAAANVGYATPAYRNSQCLDNISGGAEFNLEPRVFSPGTDGHRNIITLNYKLPDPGFLINVGIFSESGIKVKTLANNDLPGSSGFYSWDGLSDRHTLCPSGSYICYIEIYSINGSVKRVKKVFAIL
ncbi:MAG: lamin tail domain-containing protein [Bacteroidota bacterium]